VSDGTTDIDRRTEGFLAGGGEMGERIRAFDWSKTPLGPVAHWPQSLRSATSILLPSKAQIVLFWGPDLITLYNDAYRPVFGGKHPEVRAERPRTVMLLPGFASKLICLTIGTSDR